MDYSNRKVVMNESLIRDLIDATFDTGYYQAIMEKSQLSDNQYTEYARLNRLAISRRENLRSRLLDKFR